MCSKLPEILLSGADSYYSMPRAVRITALGDARHRNSRSTQRVFTLKAHFASKAYEPQMPRLMGRP